MQSNGMMKSSALALDMSVSAPGALGVLDQERRQPKAKYFSFFSAFPSLHTAEICLSGTTSSSLLFSPCQFCPTFSLFCRSGRWC